MSQKERSFNNLPCGSHFGRDFKGTQFFELPTTDGIIFMGDGGGGACFAQFIKKKHLTIQKFTDIRVRTTSKYFQISSLL